MGFGAQSYYVGSAIYPSELKALPYAERSKRIISAINSLGPNGLADIPFTGDEAFGRKVDEMSGETQVQKVLNTCLTELPDLGEKMQSLFGKLDRSKPQPENLTPAELILAGILGRL